MQIWVCLRMSQLKKIFLPWQSPTAEHQQQLLLPIEAYCLHPRQHASHLGTEQLNEKAGKPNNGPKMSSRWTVGCSTTLAVRAPCPDATTAVFSTGIGNKEPASKQISLQCRSANEAISVLSGIGFQICKSCRLNNSKTPPPDPCQPPD